MGDLEKIWREYGRDQEEAARWAGWFTIATLGGLLVFLVGAAALALLAAKLGWHP